MVLHAQRLPAGTDVAEVESRVLLRMWQTVSAADLTDAVALARLLAVTERCALVDAARADDWLPRRLRTRMRRAQRRVDIEEQALGRHLAVAEAIALTGCDPRVAERRPTTLHTTLDLDQRVAQYRAIPGPEAELVSSERAEEIRAWIESLPRSGDRRQLLRRLRGDVPIAAPLAHGIRERACRNGLADLVADSVR